MRWITNPALKPLQRAPLLDERTRAEFIQGLSDRQSSVITDLTAVELARRGFRRVVAGSRLYNAIEDQITARLYFEGIDLDEVAARIEEAKWEAGYSPPHAAPLDDEYTHSRRSHRWEFEEPHNPNTASIAAINHKSNRRPQMAKAQNYTPTPLRPSAPVRTEARSMFRDENRPRQQHNDAPKVEIEPPAVLDKFVRALPQSDQLVAVFLIRSLLTSQGMPSTIRTTGTIWKRARNEVLSAVHQSGRELSDIRADIEGDGGVIPEALSTEGLYFDDPGEIDMDALRAEGY